MAIELLIENIPSLVRAATEPREIATNELSGQSSGLIEGIWNQVKGFVGFVSGKILAVIRAIDFKRIWQWLVNTTMTIWNFNWQISDADINARIAARWGLVENRMFGLLGKAFGYLACGVLPGAAIFAFNKFAGARALLEVGEEAVDELLSDIGLLVLDVWNAAYSSFFLSAYKSIRGLIKKAARSPKFRGMVSKFIDPGMIDNWGSEKAKAWSFASNFQDMVNSFGSERLTENVEEFTEEFSEGCIEAGYALAGGLDDFMLEQTGGTLGDFILKVGAEKVEQFKLLATGKSAAPQAQDLLNSIQAIDNRDIGVIVSGYEPGEKIITESIGIQLELGFINFEEPPYYTKERKALVVKSVLTVPNIEKTKVTWENLKLQFGNVAFTKGGTLAQAQLDNGRILKCYVQTDQDAEKMLEKLAFFSEAKIVWPANAGKLIGIGKSTNPTARRVNEPQYLSYIRIYNYNKLNRIERFEGKVKPPKKAFCTKLLTHFKLKPTWWDEQLREALRDTVNKEPDQ